MNTAKFLKKVEGLATLERPRYSPGLLLEDEDLTAGVDYTREITRLLFRSLFGCGVICGLDVKAMLKCKRTELHVEVGPGVGLDGSGNPLHVPKTHQVAYDPDCEPMPPVVWVVLCYKDKNCRPKDVSCSGEGDNRSEHTRSRDGFVIKLYDGLPECACTCAKPEPGKPGRRLGRCCHDEEEEYEAAQRHAKAKKEGALRDLEEREYRVAVRERGVIAREHVALGHRPAGLAELLPPHVPGAPLPAPAFPAAPAPAPAAPAAPAPAPAEPPEKPEICACYEDHNAGKCIPDCGCSCVVLARIETETSEAGDDDVEVDANNAVRRRIRPVLTGYLECLVPEKEPEPVPTPAPPLKVKCSVEPSNISAGGRAVVTAEVEGDDGATLTYTWTKDTVTGTLTPSGSSATFQSVATGNPFEVKFTVEVIDDRGRRARNTCTLQIIEIN